MFLKADENFCYIPAISAVALVMNSALNNILKTTIFMKYSVFGDTVNPEGVFSDIIHRSVAPEQINIKLLLLRLMNT